MLQKKRKLFGKERLGFMDGSSFIVLSVKDGVMEIDPYYPGELHSLVNNCISIFEEMQCIKMVKFDYRGVNVTVTKDKASVTITKPNEWWNDMLLKQMSFNSNTAERTWEQYKNTRGGDCTEVKFFANIVESVISILNSFTVTQVADIARDFVEFKKTKVSGSVTQEITKSSLNESTDLKKLSEVWIYGREIKKCLGNKDYKTENQFMVPVELTLAIG